MQVRNETQTGLTAEIKIVPLWAWALGGIAFIVAQVFFNAVLGRHSGAPPAWGRALMGLGAGLAGACYLLLIGYINRDAKRRGMSPTLWTIMYSFLQDGEFVQLTVEDKGRVTGFISRYGDLESDRGEFLDLFFKEGKLEGTVLNFTTQTVHGVWYDFKGRVERGPGKSPGDEAYYLLKGTLIQNTTDANKKTTAKSRDVAFKSFPKDLDTPAQK